jgi:hypothetical protein
LSDITLKKSSLFTDYNESIAKRLPVPHVQDTVPHAVLRISAVLFVVCVSQTGTSSSDYFHKERYLVTSRNGAKLFL